MAKKKTKAATTAKKTSTTKKKARSRVATTTGKKAPRRSSSNPKTDQQTLKRIKEMGETVVDQSLSLKDPFVDVPTRSISNVSYNKTQRMLEMGSATQRRNLFNLSQAKKFMQTLLVAEGCQDLIGAGKTLSLRGMFYKTLHTISKLLNKTVSGMV